MTEMYYSRIKNKTMKVNNCGTWRSTLIFIFLVAVSFVLYSTQVISPTILANPLDTTDEDVIEYKDCKDPMSEYEIKISAANIVAKLSEKSYQSFVKKREGFIKNNPESIKPWQTNYRFPSFWDYFVPLFTCPFPIDRVGNLGDGGKFVCGLDVISALNRPCVIYSFGVNGQSDFEADLLEKTPCSIYAYDATNDKMGPEIADNEPRVHFNKIFIGAQDTEEAQTLGKMMELNGHDWIDILKMDIEGGEFEVLDQIMDQFQILPFGQLQIEIHGDQAGATFPKIYRLWKRMEEKGLRPFKNELNPWVVIWGYGGPKTNPFLMEYAFLNTKGEKALVKLD